MRAVIQRVSEAKVRIEGKIHSSISRGLLVLVGIEDADTEEDGLWLSHKIAHLRIFDDAQVAKIEETTLNYEQLLNMPADQFLSLYVKK